MRPRVRDIVEIVAAEFKVPPLAITGEQRTADVTLARHAAMWLAARRTALSNAAIGREVGRRDHSTVINARRRIDRMLGTDVSLSKLVAGCEARLDASFPAAPEMPPDAVATAHRVLRKLADIGAAAEAAAAEAASVGDHLAAALTASAGARRHNGIAAAGREIETAARRAVAAVNDARNQSLNPGAARGARIAAERAVDELEHALRRLDGVRSGRTEPSTQETDNDRHFRHH